MNVLLVSQCSKRALTETRRILDQFAERRGDRTWQTAITQEGLDTLRRLLRKTARKNTAVACHWIRGRNHSELMWVVGDARQFNAQGAVPTNMTRRDVLRSNDENDWHTTEDIRLLAQLAALLHDLGKASEAFQDRLRGRLKERNRYRHEWVSLRMFQAFVDQDGDEAWLQRLADPATKNEQSWIGAGRYQRDGLDDAVDRYPFRTLPPLAAAVGWLVVTHHRLPQIPVKGDGGQRRLGTRSPSSVRHWLDDPLAQVSHDSNEIAQVAERSQIEPYWQPDGPLPVIDTTWQAQAARLAKRLLVLRGQRDDDWLGNPYVMHLARLSLMLADHHYSALSADSPQRVKTESQSRLYANTDTRGHLKQTLDEHLMGVARDAGLIAHALPGFECYLPRLANHRGLRKRSGDSRFAWQDKAFDAASAMRETAREHGAFIVNMASTGCGKTLANARILYALADPQQGMRATYALGLRTLTLQTGRSFRTDLHLGDDDLALLVGGSANRNLFEYYEQQAEALGSGSIQDLLEEDSHVLYEGVTADHPLLSRALQDPAIRKMLSAPVLVCTVDHIVPATEAPRAGRQIAPMLRLLSSDLILDELDDYDLNDLPALTRLVHWAGMLGTRVLLSSATLPPALVEGMFMAYCAGRTHYLRNRGRGGGSIAAVSPLCLWADEFGAHSTQCADADAFRAQHLQFVRKRAASLLKAVPLRRAELLPLDIPNALPHPQIHAAFARHVLDACLRLHADHAQTDPQSGKTISFGLVRMANIDPLFDVARTLFELGAPENAHIHLCVYHARLPLVQRSAIEHLLDTAFNRRPEQGQAVYRLPSVRSQIDAHTERNHLFIVLASPVCEVGRDWDADWAIAEPSSMRSLIQLAGRVQRHRRLCSDKPNVLVFDRNVKALKRVRQGNAPPEPVFVRPGFERADPPNFPFQLRTTRLEKLLPESEYRVLTAVPRILPRPESEWDSRQRLVDLEHARIAASMLPRDRVPAAVQLGPPTVARDEATWSWRSATAMLTAVLPQQQPFRDSREATEMLVLLPDDEGENPVWHRVEEVRDGKKHLLYVPVPDDARVRNVDVELGPRISVWGDFDLMQLLAEQAEQLDLPLADCAKKFAVVQLPRSDQGWPYHPWLGFRRI